MRSGAAGKCGSRIASLPAVAPRLPSAEPGRAEMGGGKGGRSETERQRHRKERRERKETERARAQRQEYPAAWFPGGNNLLL